MPRDANPADSISVKIETWAFSRAGEETQKVTESVFTFVAIDGNGNPREMHQDPSA